MLSKLPRNLAVDILLFSFALIAVVFITMDSTEEFTPSMIRKLAPAVKLLVTEDDRNNFGQGTGFFISPEGHMLTNYHVVKSSKRIVILDTGG